LLKVAEQRSIRVDDVLLLHHIRNSFCVLSPTNFRILSALEQRVAQRMVYTEPQQKKIMGADPKNGYKKQILKVQRIMRF